MKPHERIMSDFHRMIDEKGDIEEITPASLALNAMSIYSKERLEPEIEYTSYEHLKGMARKALARRYDHGDGEEAYGEDESQGSLFKQLQERYPVPKVKGREPTYKLRSHLSEYERAWNVGQLRKAGRARLAHADALEAEGESAPKSAA